MGSYLLRFCDEIPQIGDYVGLAATGSRVAAAFVLPQTAEPTSRATVYGALSDVRQASDPAVPGSPRSTFVDASTGPEEGVGWLGPVFGLHARCRNDVARAGAAPYFCTRGRRFLS
jgi:hypothetical protein